MEFKEPVVLKNIINGAALIKFQALCDITRQKVSFVAEEDKQFRRFGIHSPKAFLELHRTSMLELAERIFGEALKPSYTFLSLYTKGEGICPYHVDRPQCYRTIDVCLSQNEPWPLYVNSKVPKFEDEAEYYKKMDEIKAAGTSFLLEPGDALLYSGTDHPHWREKIQDGNFCNLVFFHFVRSDFDGPLI